MRIAPTTITCAHCGEPAKMHAYRIRNGTGKYCSQRCYLAARWGGEGKCRQCQQPCETQFCGSRCQKDYWNNNGYRLNKKDRHWERKIALIDELGGKCVRCGFADFRALDIHHRDASRKSRPKDGHYIWTRRLKDWEANRGNLELMCANCHRLHTWEQRGFGRGVGALDEKIRLFECFADPPTSN